jgi:hypothetical protein
VGEHRLLYPIVVNSAAVYAVDATAPDIEAIEVAWATVTRELRSTKIDGQFNLDVVNSAALDRYMSERVHCSAT